MACLVDVGGLDLAADADLSQQLPPPRRSGREIYEILCHSINYTELIDALIVPLRFHAR
jgi:hypothetical protein